PPPCNQRPRGPPARARIHSPQKWHERFACLLTQCRGPKRRIAVGHFGGIKPREHRSRPPVPPLRGLGLTDRLRVAAALEAFAVIEVSGSTSPLRRSTTSWSAPLPHNGHGIGSPASSIGLPSMSVNWSASNGLTRAPSLSYYRPRPTVMLSETEQKMA